MHQTERLRLISVKPRLKIRVDQRAIRKHGAWSVGHGGRQRAKSEGRRL